MAGQAIGCETNVYALCFYFAQMCKVIDDPSKGDDDFAKLYGAANIYYNYSGGISCFDLMDDSDPHGLGGWAWQVPHKFSLS